MHTHSPTITKLPPTAVVTISFDPRPPDFTPSGFVTLPAVTLPSCHTGFPTSTINGWQVDQTIQEEKLRVVAFSFGYNWDPYTRMNEVLHKVSKNKTLRSCYIQRFGQQDVYISYMTYVRPFFYREQAHHDRLRDG